MSREFLRRFHILRPIATGAFGEVFLAKEVHADGFSRLVALKLLHHRWSGNVEVTQRLRDEARLLGWLRHRNILDVVDLTSIDGRTALIMEYIEGIDLGFLIGAFYTTESLVPMRACLQIAAYSCSALDAAYNRPPYPGEKPLRVIHRDIKPSNIMVDEGGAVKVLDFGVARAEFDERESKTQDLQFGSVEYMPPERLFFEPDTPASDVYSLGVTLFELIAVGKFGKAQPRPADHAGTVRDRLSYLRARRGISGAPADDFDTLMTEMLSYELTERPTAAEATSRLRELARRFDDLGIAEWAPDFIPPLLAQFRDASGKKHPLVGSLLSEDTSVLRQDPETGNAFRQPTGGRPLPQDAPSPPRLSTGPRASQTRPFETTVPSVETGITENVDERVIKQATAGADESRPTQIVADNPIDDPLQTLDDVRPEAPRSVETRVLGGPEALGEDGFDEDRPTDPGALDAVIANLHRSAELGEETVEQPYPLPAAETFPPTSVETEPTPSEQTGEQTTTPSPMWQTDTHPGDYAVDTQPSKRKESVETVPTPKRRASASWLPAAAVLLAPLTGTVLGFVWFQPSANALDAPAPAPEQVVSPVADIPPATTGPTPVPEPAAAQPISEPAEGMIRFRAADGNTAKLIARCNEQSGKGEIEASVEAEGTTLCTISAVFALEGAELNS